MATTTPAPAPHAPATTEPSTFSFWWARLSSFLAIVPLGVWTFIHLWNNLYAFSGADAWQRKVTEYPHPAAELFNGVIVFLPLLIHTVWGIQRLFSARPNTYPAYDNLKYILQRVTAVGVLLFLGAHIWRAYLNPHLVEHHAELFEDFAREMSGNLPTLVVYLLGTLGVAFHLANGLSSFAWTWGWVSGRSSVARMDKVALVLFLILWAMSWGAIYAVWSAGAALGIPQV